MKKLPLVLNSAAFSAALACTPSVSHAAVYYWNSTTTGLWATGANWSNNATSGGTTGTVPLAADTVVFNQSSVNGNEVVQLGAAQTIAGMTFANTGTTLVTSSSSTPRILTLGASGITVNSGAGAVTIGDATNVLNVSLSSNATTFTLNGSNGVTFANTLTNTNSGGNITNTVNGAGNTLTLGNYNLGNASTGKVVAFNGSANVQINGIVADNSTTASNLAYSGTGTLTLAGNNTYTGTTSIGGGGTVSIGGVSGLGSATSAVIFTAGNLAAGKLSYTGNSATFTRGFSLTNANTIGQIDTTTAGQTLTIATGNIAFSVSSQTLVVGGAGNTTISSNITGGGKLTKQDAGTLLLSGANTFTGKTTISGGTLQYGLKSSLYNGTTASWTAANITAASGATLALRVGGAGEFAASDVNTLLTNISVAGAGTGLQAGAKIGFDTTNASGGTFTQGNVIANSTGANGGAIGLTKLGSGTLVLDKVNTYTGNTTVSGGTLAFGAAQSLAGNLALAGGTLDSGTFASSFGGGLDLDGNSSVTLGSGGTLAFADSHLLDWGSFTLSISGTFIDGASIRFGTDASGLDSGQLGLISVNNVTGWTLSDTGYLTAIPEPSAFAALAGLAGLGLAAIRRRRVG